jgi:PPM family protein phosphatase
VFKLEFAAQVDQGLVRETNQDVARVVPGLGLALVADGMGGHDHGDVASRTAANGLEQSFARFGGPGVNIDETAQRLQSAFREVNQRIADHPTSGEGRAKMGTTLVAAVFAHGRVAIGNVGDSRCYRLRDRSLELLTQDHSYAEQLRQSASSATPEGEQAASEWAHILTRCLNGDEGVAADIRIVRCEPGDIFLLCSDGLWGSVSGDVMAGILGAAEDASEACERLIGAAWAGGGLDNIGTAVVRLVPLQLRLDEPSWLEQPTRPSEQPGGDA